MLTRDEALAELRKLKAQHSNPKDRWVPGWDRRLQQQVINILIAHTFGTLDGESSTLKFLDAAISQFEIEEMIDVAINRPKVGT